MHLHLSWWTGQVVAKVRRVGGGFGGKVTHNIKVSSAAALAAKLTNQQVRVWGSSGFGSPQGSGLLRVWGLFAALAIKLINQQADVLGSLGWKLFRF